MGRSRPRRMGWSLMGGSESAREKWGRNEKQMTIKRVRIGAGSISGGERGCARGYARGMSWRSINALRWGFGVYVLCWAAGLLMGQEPGAIAADQAAVPAAVLEKMDRRERGDLYRADLAPKLRGAH